MAFQQLTFVWRKSGGIRKILVAITLFFLLYMYISHELKRDAKDAVAKNKIRKLDSRDAVAENKSGKRDSRDAVVEKESGKLKSRDAVAENKRGKRDSKDAVAENKIGKRDSRDAVAEKKSGKRDSRDAVAEKKSGSVSGETTANADYHLTQSYSEQTTTQALTSRLPPMSPPPGSKFSVWDPEWLHLHHYGYIKRNEDFCRIESGSDREVFLLVMVIADPRQIQERDFFRTTFGSVREHQGKLIRVLYVLGRTPSASTEIQVEREMNLHNDILKLDMHDSYENYTLKSILGYKWALEHCPKAKLYMKVGQDVMANFRRIVEYFSALPSNLTYFITGVMREPGGIVSNDRPKGWPLSTFPNYILGHSCIQTMDTVKPFYREALRHPLFMEDMYVAYVLDRINVSFIDNPYFCACPWTTFLTDICENRAIFSVHTQSKHKAEDWPLDRKYDYWKLIQYAPKDIRDKCPDVSAKWHHINQKECDYMKNRPRHRTLHARTTKGLLGRGDHSFEIKPSAISTI